MRTPAYVQRFVRVARALAILPNYPDGMRLDDLAARLGTSEDELRDEILAYYAADVTVDQFGGAYHEPVIEFIGGPLAGDDADDVEPAEAAFVRLRDMRPESEVGTRFLSFGQLAALAAAGQELLVVEPDNTVLASALDVVTSNVLPGAVSGEPMDRAGVERRLLRAASERRRVQIQYMPAWKAGVVERVIEPYRIVHTRRGWEVDAAIVDHAAAVTTLLMAGIVSVEELDERFVRPPDADQRIERNHRAQPVSLVVPHRARWAVERFADSAELVDEDDEVVNLWAYLLPPVGPQLGLLLLAAGPDAFVVEPAKLQDAGRDLARALLVHHGAS